MLKMMQLFVFLLVIGTSSSSPNPKKRSLIQFGEMLECLSDRSIVYNGYGCWCGKGGSGAPVDGLDRCCQEHDRCWDAYSDNLSCFWYWSPFLEEYEYSGVCHGERSVSCDSSANSSCEKQLCECDRAAAMCFARNTFHDIFKDYNKDTC